MTNECLRSMAALFLCFAVWAGGAQAQSVGLYKDGKQVIDFGSIVGPDRAARDGGTAGAQFLERVFGPRRAGGNPAREYVRMVMECRALVDALGGGSRAPSAAEPELERLTSLARGLRQACEGEIVQLNEVAGDLDASRSASSRRARRVELQTRYRAHGEELSALIEDLRASVDQGRAAEAQDVLLRLDRFLPAAGSQVASPPPSLPAPRITPFEVRPPVVVDPGTTASIPSLTKPSGIDSRLAYDPADLQETIDVQFTGPIATLAAELGHSPARMYEFVRNNVEFECYLGSRKGSGLTLEHRKGNDFDQASLLIALLRSSGIPARYSEGRARISGAMLDEWLGFEDRYTAAVMLNSAGFQVSIYGSPANITAIALERVWVEAWIPYTNYRGAPNDTTGSRWVPMDPVFDEHQFSQPLNIYDELGLDAEQFVQSFTSMVRSETPVQALRAVMLDTLLVNHPGSTFEDMVQVRTPVEETDGIVPGTLPFELLSSEGTFSAIASNMRYRVRFHLYNGGAALDYVTSTPELASKQVTLSYVGATPADQQAIDNAGGIWYLPNPSLVNLQPVLKVDGCIVAQGTGAIMTGTYQNSDMEFTPPVGAPIQVSTIQNYILAGNYQGLGIDTEDVLPASFGISPTACGEEYMGQVVHQAAITYLNNVDTADDSLAALMHVAVTNDVSEAIVENTITVWVDFMGNPVELEWTGMLVDADRKIVGPFSLHGDDVACDFLRIGGADGSFQEHRLFESVFGEEAISTMKILALANQQGIGVCRITSSIAAECPGMSQYPEVVSYINSYVAAGYHVYVPKSPLTYYNWTGTAWIALDPVTCAAGYIIYGGQSSSRVASGGATVQTWTISYQGLQCLNPSGAIDVDPPGDYYCATDTRRWTFTVNALKYVGKNSSGTPCQQLYQENKQFIVTNHTIKELADDPNFGPGEYVFRVGGPSDCPECVEKEKKVTVFKLDLVTPAGDPVGAPIQSGDGQNEFTYSSANTGVLTVNLKAKIRPSGAAGQVKDRLKFTVGAVGSSTMIWNQTNPGGKPTANGDYLLATVQFSGLPTSNADFGAKMAAIFCDNVKQDEKPYEVFYPRDAANHPGGQTGSPNWFHYWVEAIGAASAVYSAGNQLYGECPGMLHWSYASSQNKSTVIIYDPAATEDPGDVNADHGQIKTTGIDTFEDTYLHEHHHTVQIAQADPVVGILTNSPWRYGWSFNQSSHNHWTTGVDGKPGAAGVDDDSNGTVDDLIVSGPGELGGGDDVILDLGYDWPQAFGSLPPTPWAGGTALEDPAYNQEPDTENARAPLDWGNPGKQHKTVNKYND